MSTFEIRVTSCSNVLSGYFPKLPPIFIDRAIPECNLSRVFGDSLPSIIQYYRNAAFVFKNLVACSLNIVACSSSSLLRRVVFVLGAGVYRERNSNISAVGKTFVKKFLQILILIYIRCIVKGFHCNQISTNRY